MPPEDDPDSFVRAHSFSEVEQYINENETDFIKFKSSVVLKDAQNDPIKRTAAITDVVKSIAVIPDEIARMVYAKECSSLFEMDEQAILRQIKHYRGKFLEEWRNERQKQQAREQRMSQQSGDTLAPPPGADDVPQLPPADDFIPSRESVEAPPTTDNTVSVKSDIDAQEREVIRLVVNYGMCYLTDTKYEDGSVLPTTVLEYISNELQMVTFNNPLYLRTFEIAKQYLHPFYQDLDTFNAQLEERVREYAVQEMAKEEEDDPDAMDSATLINAQERREKAAQARANVRGKNELEEFRSSYLMKALCSIDDDEVRRLACDLAADNMPQLSRIHSEFAVILEERDKLTTLVDNSLYIWQNALLGLSINEVKAQIAHAPLEEQPSLMKQLQELYSKRHIIAAIIGDRVVNPK
ncbi:MAG: hypothetical protein IKX18_01540 [Muribaculaceae bacterium]|nr:hypothetical protein [Muribaculaceae bacterium]